MEGNRDNYPTKVEIKNHHFARLADVGDDPLKLVIIENKSSGLKHDYILFNYLEGYITSIAYGRTNNGHDILRVKVSNDEDERLLSMPFFLDPCIHFLQRIEDIQYSRMVQIHIGHSTDDTTGYTSDYLWITQDGNKVPIRYGVDNRGGRPEWELINGIYNKSKEYEFFKGKVRDIVSRVSLLSGGPG